MSRDIFDTLDKAGFGSNVHEIAAEGECRVLRLDDESGEGFMTMYRVFDGIYLMYNDFHMKHCISEYQNADTELLRSTDKDITVLIVTHDMEQIDRCCTHILHIENGGIESGCKGKEAI